MNPQGSDGQDDKSEKGKQPERRMRRYQPHWQEAFPWVFHEDEINKMFCKLCQDNQDVSDPASAYLFGGCCNFQIMSLQSHAKSKGHMNAVEAERTKPGGNQRLLAWSHESSSDDAVLSSLSISPLHHYQRFINVQLSNMNSQRHDKTRMVGEGLASSPVPRADDDDDEEEDGSIVYPKKGRPIIFQVGPPSSTKNTSRSPSHLILDNGRSSQKLCNMFFNAHAVSKACMSFEDYQWLCELDAAKGLDMDDDQTANVCREILNVIARIETPKIKNAIEECKFFSVVCDTFTGASADMVVIYVKVFDRGKQWLNILDVLTIDPCTNDTLLNVLSMTLSKELTGVAWRRKLIGVVYSVDMAWHRPLPNDDSAASDTSGVSSDVKLEPDAEREASISTLKEGVAVQLESIPQSVLSHRCLLHHMQEVVAKTITGQSYDRTVRHSIRTIKHCCTDLFVEDAGLHDADSWTENRLADIRVIVEKYSEIITALGKDGGGTIDVCKTFCFIKYIHFLSDILEVLVYTFRTLRDDNTNIGVLYESISDAVDNFRKLQKRSGQQLSKVENETTFQGQLLDTTDAQAFDEERESILRLLIGDLISRLGDLQESKMAAMAKLASLEQWPIDSDDLKDYADEDLLLVLETYSSVLKDNGVHTDRCLMEWSQLKNHIRRRFSNPNNTSWKRIFPTCQGKCENILHVISFILTLPGQTIQVENGYRHLKETKHGTKLTAGEVRDRLRIYHNTPAIGEFNPGPFIGTFQEEMARDGGPPMKRLRKVSKEEDDIYAIALNIAPTLE